MIKKIPVSLYKTGVVVIVEKDKEKAIVALRKNGVHTPIPEFANGCCWTEKGYWPIVWIKSLRDIPTYCHEITHACYGIFESKGVLVDNNNHEALTYLQSFILEKLLNK